MLGVWGCADTRLADAPAGKGGHSARRIIATRDSQRHNAVITNAHAAHFAPPNQPYARSALAAGGYHSCDTRSIVARRFGRVKQRAQLAFEGGLVEERDAMAAAGGIELGWHWAQDSG